MDSPEVFDDLDAWPEHEVVGVGEHYCCSRGREQLRGDALDGGGGAHWHEYRRFDLTVGGVEQGSAGGC